MCSRIKEFRFFEFGRGWGAQKGFECCPVVALSFFCLFHPWVFKNFLASALDYLFRVFTLESCFFFFHHFLFFLSVFFLLSYYAFENSKFIPNGWMIYQNVWLRKRDDNLVDYENFLKEKPLQSKYPHSMKMDFYNT